MSTFFSYQSILSELNDSGKLDTASILHNDKNYPTFSSVEELLLHPDNDPTGIQHQFESFATADNVAYPLILIRDDIFSHAEALKKLESLVSQLLDDNGDQEEYDIISVLRERGYDKPKSYSLESIEDVESRNQFISRFEAVHDLFESQPLIRHLVPGENGNVTSETEAS